jgi:hypothetical protein
MDDTKYALARPMKLAFVARAIPLAMVSVASRTRPARISTYAFSAESGVCSAIASSKRPSIAKAMTRPVCD